MIIAAVDTNVLVRGAIASHPTSASKGVVDAFFAGRFLLLLSPEVVAEIETVLTVDTVRAKHGLSDEEIVNFCRALQAKGRMIETVTVVPASLTRDPSDTKWVALVTDGEAGYLVTRDWRHLGRLKQVGKTKVVSPKRFLEVLQAAGA